MTTPLDKPLKREVDIGGAKYTLTLTPAGLKLTPKGARKGIEVSWQSLVSGDAALAAALNASISQNKDTK
ncbi:MAG TPA: hypothetical protein VFB01_00965 [Burkholderiales bacterium]|jgi:hypothetical protein|nr:hypothetical protein [Burkholderiales bacterium]